nr:putative ribonuclease H-like domain-containing protein [Tanacetum cinerariifolium]
SKKHDDKNKREAKGKSPVESVTGYRNLSVEFEDFSDNSINEDNAAGSLVLAVGQLSPNSTNTFSAAGLSNAAASLTHGKYSCMDTSQYPDDPNMPELEDITYSDDEDDVGAEADLNNLETSITVSPIPTRVHKDHHINNYDFHTCMFACFLSQKEPKRVHQALKDPSWIEAMQEELLQFKLQKVWVLVDLPHGKRAIGHTQEEGIDYEEVFAPVARIEAIRLFLAYASFTGFMVYQMDVKSAFLYGTIDEEVYICQPPGFKDPDYPEKVYKVVKALYGLHQAPRAWYEALANYLLENGFQRGKIDQTLFIKRQKGDILLVQIYVDDILFGSTNKDLCKAFEKLMKDKFQMSSMGELTFFLGLQVKQKKDGIFISQDKYVAKILRKFALTDGKSASTPIDTEKPLLMDPNGEDVDVHTYRSMIGSLIYEVYNWRMSILWMKIDLLAMQEAKLLPLHPLRLRVNTPRCDEDRLELMELTVFLLPSDEKIRVEVSAVDLQVSAVRLILLLEHHEMSLVCQWHLLSSASPQVMLVLLMMFVPTAIEEPSIPSPTPPTPPPQPSQDQPSTSQVHLTPPY